MMGRIRKPLWERVELNYFRQRPTYRTWKRWLSVGCAVLAVGWVVVAATRDDESMYISGPLSSGHELLADACLKCHTVSWQGLHRLISAVDADQSMNRACLNCHGSTIDYDSLTWSARHQKNDSDASDTVQTLACHRCHTEHKGPVRLTDVSDSSCVTCHADLFHEDPQTRFAQQITAFHVDHPQFRILAANRPDETSIQLNHQLHLKPTLRGPGGVVQMQCADCHRAGRSSEHWPYGQAGRRDDVGRAVTSSEPDLQAAYMHPIRYSLHCMKCHELTVDISDHQPDGRNSIPHESPHAIRIYLRGQLLEYIRKNPEALIQTSRDRARHPTLRDLTPSRIDRLSLEWIEQRLYKLERKLYKAKKVCLLCHDQEWPEDNSGLPTIVSPDIPERWFGHASFNHEKHRVWDCYTCHDQATSSSNTTDILLPDIETCRQCHAPRNRQGAIPSGGVAFNCVRCHTYHRSPSGHLPNKKRSLQDVITLAPVLHHPD